MLFIRNIQKVQVLGFGIDRGVVSRSHMSIIEIAYKICIDNYKIMSSF